MNILIVGSGQGSWTMRGLQLGAALGARVTSSPSDVDWHWADLVILVKRAGPNFAQRARELRVPIVWDALDFWRQPDENSRSEASARTYLRQMVDIIQPTLTIGATEAMARAAGGVCLPHHGRLELMPTPARETFKTIGYDGNPLYLDSWAQALASLCAARGWSFVVNPLNLADVDLLVALRGGIWDGWMCREWKSGVKLVNAILAGRPVITQDTAAMCELNPAGNIIDRPSQLAAVIDSWVPLKDREAVAESARTRAQAFTVEALSARYRDILARVGAPLEASC